MTFTWQNGRQLATVVKVGTNIGTYTYNDSGVRQSKTVKGVTTNYTTSGTQILSQKTGSEYFDFFYDEIGNVYGFSYNGTMYYYTRNGQGDIIGIIDNTGTVVARYIYDAWGDLEKITDGNGVGKTMDTSFIGYKNPFRYRGYFYDSSTGLYNCLSRYYDPVTGRFLNADGLISTGQGILGYNMYAYCGNNPVIRADPSGYSYATLPDGTRMSMNSLADVTVFNKRRAEQLSTLASRDVAWIVPAEVVAHNDKMIEELQPLLQVLAKKFLVNANDDGIGLIITDGFRTRDAQIDASAASGQYPSRNISRHEDGRAIDVHIWDASLGEYHYQPIRASIGIWCDCQHDSDNSIRTAYSNLVNYIPDNLYWGGNYIGMYDPVEFYINWPDGT